jgi:hypothetical protein
LKATVLNDNLDLLDLKKKKKKKKKKIFEVDVDVGRSSVSA